MLRRRRPALCKQAAERGSPLQNAELRALARRQADALFRACARARSRSAEGQLFFLQSLPLLPLLPSRGACLCYVRTSAVSQAAVCVCVCVCVSTFLCVLVRNVCGSVYMCICVFASVVCVYISCCCLFMFVVVCVHLRVLLCMFVHVFCAFMMLVFLCMCIV